jgi:uncharacterized repeat protein (TIGR03803 family)
MLQNCKEGFTGCFGRHASRAISSNERFENGNRSLVSGKDAFSLSGRIAAKRLNWGVLAAAFALAACGRQTAGFPVGASQAPFAPARQPEAKSRPSVSGSYRILHSFGSGHDGYDPEAGLVAVRGMLYGTTVSGGAYGGGTIFRLSASGTEQVLHSFGSGADGAEPLGGLIEVDDTMYGTTKYGGKNGEGVVFSITMLGDERVVYSFGGAADGQHPEAALLYHKGEFYGTTRDGGTANRGTVFGVHVNGAERVVYGFRGGSDGSHPVSSLIDVDGTLYGTTLGGTVYAVTPSGEEHAAVHLSGGAFSLAELLYVGHGLLGTTYNGGPDHAGTVFGIGADGSVQRLHDFGRGADGAEPVAGLIVAGGVVYGTTSNGGDGRYGNGTVFTISSAGEDIIYSFGATPHDGDAPMGPLVEMNGTLYGTTAFGGAHDTGTGVGGTVFSL